MSYRLVLWDFDGTLVNSLADALSIYNRIAARDGYRQITESENVRDLSMSQFIRRYGIPLGRIPLMFREFLQLQRESVKHFRIVDGLPETLRRLSGDGVMLGVVSSNNTDNIRTCLQRNGIDSLFGSITGTSRLQGKSRRLKIALRQFDCSAAETLYVGDEIRDIHAAQAADVDIAAVTWGLNSAAALAEYSPTWQVNTPRELEAVVAQSR